jgi:hypothetical protein
MYSGTFKSVCYQCSYEGTEEHTRCPVCRFPMILEPENSPPGGFRLDSILARATVRDGGPPLPGVHAGKRQAQLREEARRERRGSQVETRVRRNLPLPAPPEPGSELTIPIRRSWTAIKYGLLCASALAAGVVAAALQSS